jgi:hypothetical protein
MEQQEQHEMPDKREAVARHEPLKHAARDLVQGDLTTKDLADAIKEATIRRNTRRIAEDVTAGVLEAEPRVGWNRVKSWLQDRALKLVDKLRQSFQHSCLIYIRYCGHNIPCE